MKKLAIIGFGASAIGFLKGFIEDRKNEKFIVDVYEKGENIETSGFGGLKYDGKLFISKEMGGDLEIPLNIQKKVVEYYLIKSGYAEKKNNGTLILSEKLERGNSFENEQLYRKFYDAGFEPIISHFFHLGTDILTETVKNIYKEFLETKNINFKFGEEVTKVLPSEKQVIVISNKSEESYDNVIIAVGRRGHKLVNNLVKDHPELVLSNDKVDLGIRYELPNHVVEDLNKEMYEFKIRLKTKTGYIVRTFCNNPSGEVTLEKYDDFVTVNGHANSDKKTHNTNFAILVTHSFTQPFNDPIGYGSYISKLSNILAGGDKVILQCYEDFKNSKRTKKLGRVEPTLNPNFYILGDLNLALPRRTIESIIDFLERLEKVIQGITYPDNLLYGAEVKFYANKINNEHFGNIKIVGDCSGWTRSITYATGHGYIVSKNIE
ncbi:NAD(P)/FAD-dependent oxidoreductase [Petrotoga sp. 9PWA.NaAc.5.4]|uniref:NAD(P)/FAD-dependent oxidoreductase n=1 Tax=Petrotoga sp. 9PWA.NaAc.5.4 TaxID=1434328 RepID=UPI000CA88627|nr:NAD(P)/FAD-dependent oxidoreductase [Petrotoga sp. 9PWA.NaAc.5.4]PNR95367.1 FAD-dependent dehydrogenase [Petrotoga sp. 9PWA.NaAc.5.4]